MITIRIVPGTPETGLWCPKCNLPSAVRTPFNMISLRGVTKFATITHCPECQPLEEYTE